MALRDDEYDIWYYIESHRGVLGKMVQSVNVPVDASYTPLSRW